MILALTKSDDGRFILLLLSWIYLRGLEPVLQLTIPGEQCEEATSAKYVLPYPIGNSYYLLQGNCGNHSHKGIFKYAYDFRMPTGSIIVAARGGIVKRIEERFPDGNGRDEELNYILVLHDDSTASRYMHLTQNGVLVELNQRIHAGDTIALSGNTGVSTEPHLHLDVISYCTKGPCQTIPFAFSNASDKVPRQGRTYMAEAQQ